MNEIDYHKVGEVFEYNGRKYKVVDTCGECDLSGQCAGADRMNCIYKDRDDFSDVIYKEVNKRKEKVTILLLKFLSVLLLIAFGAVIVQLFFQSEYLIGLLLTLSCLYVVTDAWINGRKS